MGSKNVTDALDSIREVLERFDPNRTTTSRGQTPHRSAAGASRRHSEASGNIEFPLIALGPFEQVLAFTTDERIVLKGIPDNLHFSSHGRLVDFEHNPVPGTFSSLSFPIGDVDLKDVNLWPPPQPQPFDEPELFKEPTNRHGFSKQAYFFDNGESSLVTVGPSLPKVIRLKDGGAQFWVGSTGVITQGTGRFEGARGISAYNGSSFFKVWPESQEELFELLANGFPALVSAYFKLVLAEVLIEPEIVPPPKQSSKSSKSRN